MTGRDLIIYILQNNLEDEQVFKDGRIMGFMSVEEASIKLNVGVHTVITWIVLDNIEHIRLGDHIYIPVTSEVFNKHSQTN